CGGFALARLGRPLVLATLLVLGILDQTTEQFVPPYAKFAEEVRQIKSFVNSIERQVPPQTAIFQLPYVPFLESPSPVAMNHYDHCRPYLASTSLRWSFGAMPGRRADTVQKSVAALPAAVMVKQLCLAGFAGIWIDRNGYADQATSICGELGRL